MSPDWREHTRREIRAFMKKLESVIKNQRALRDFLKKKHNITVSTSALSKALRGNGGQGLGMDTILRIRDALRDECLNLDRTEGRNAKSIANPHVEFADGDKPLRYAVLAMATKRYSQMPVRGASTTFGVITNETIDRGISDEGMNDSMPARLFCEEPRFIPWNDTETEAVEEVIDHGYALVRERGTIVGIITPYDFQPWARILLDYRS